MSRAAATAALAALILVGSGCAARSGPPLAYLALERPDASITGDHGPLVEKHGRGGWYFWNKNFRPAPDIQVYLEQAHAHSGSAILRDADVILDVPFAFDILFFGYNHGRDKVTAKAPEER